MASLMGVGPLAFRGPLAPVGLMHGCLRQLNNSRSLDNTIRSPLLSVLYIRFNWHVESQRALSSRPSEQREDWYPHTGASTRATCSSQTGPDLRLRGKRPMRKLFMSSLRHVHSRVKSCDLFTKALTVLATACFNYIMHFTLASLCCASLVTDSM